MIRGRHEVAMTKPAVLHQEIQVNFRYGVYFTNRVFAPDNPLLAKLGSEGSDHAKKVLVAVDDGLYQHHPNLLEDIEAYPEHYPHHLHLAGPPVLLPGGERVKNEAAWISASNPEPMIPTLTLAFTICAGPLRVSDPLCFRVE